MADELQALLDQITEKELKKGASMLTPSLFRAVRETEKDAAEEAKQAAERMIQNMAIVRKNADEAWKGVAVNGKA